MSFNVGVNEPIILRLTLPENDSSKFIRAHVRNKNNVQLAGSPFTLNNLGDGRYFFKDETNLLFPSNEIEVSAVYTVYDDPAFTVPTVDYSFQNEDVFRVTTTVESAIQDSIDELTALVTKVLILSPDIEVEIEGDTDPITAEVDE